MNYYIGIDLGTSSLKGLLVNSKGEIEREATHSYPIYYPAQGFTEQNPKDWYNAMCQVLSQLTQGIEGDVLGISFGGQMHGLVILDDNDNVIRPCILWKDGRTEKETEYLNSVVGKQRLSRLTGNIAFAGFTAPKLLWLYENEIESFKKIRKIMLPKDYLAYCLTGVHSTDYSDASGTLLLDVKNKCWSKEMCEICHIDESLLPKLYESYEITGKVKECFSLPNAVVAAGAGDNAAAAIGMGTVNNGDCNISLGTSGTIFISQDNFSEDSKNALHSFVHANGKFHLMGCILSAASCRKWWLEDILNSNDYLFDEIDISKAEPCDVMFLPYLMGERSPHNDTKIRGAFIGLDMQTTRAQMSRAVMEGVAFAIRDCLEVALSNGALPSYATVCGGGAKAEVWNQIISDTLNMPVKSLKTQQGPGFGGAILAMLACGELKSFEDIAGFIETKGEYTPQNADYYEKKYQQFKKLYPALAALN